MGVLRRSRQIAKECKGQVKHVFFPIWTHYSLRLRENRPLFSIEFWFKLNLLRSFVALRNVLTERFQKVALKDHPYPSWSQLLTPNKLHGCTARSQAMKSMKQTGKTNGWEPEKGPLEKDTPLETINYWNPCYLQTVSFNLNHLCNNFHGSEWFIVKKKSPSWISPLSKKHPDT